MVTEDVVYQTVIGYFKEVDIKSAIHFIHKEISDGVVRISRRSNIKDRSEFGFRIKDLVVNNQVVSESSSFGILTRYWIPVTQIKNPDPNPVLDNLTF